MTRARDEIRKDTYGPYYDYLHTPIWPSVSQGTHEAVEDMAPQYATGCLGKLVRWARNAPQGEVAGIPDYDAREEYVRKSRLGMALAARSVNMTEEHFHAVYGEFGAYADADPHELLALTAVALGDHGLGDWPLQQRIKLAANLAGELTTAFKIGAKPQ